MPEKKVNPAKLADLGALPPPSKNPALLQINTRVWLKALSCECCKQLTLAQIPDWFFKDLAERKIEWVWLLAVWTVPAASRKVARRDPGVLKDIQSALPDASDEDICGSGFAIAKYQVAAALGGNRALGAFRHKLASYGIRLMLDFVPNHTGLDHRWVAKYPQYFIRGDKEKLEREPENYSVIQAGKNKGLILAHGRDPNFSGWSDTLQLNYANDDLQEAQTAQLLAIAAKCDGVRCDMAMLLLPRIFKKTWGQTANPFWPKAINAVRQKHPGFTFMAEAYWGTEPELIEQGFNYCYDKVLYDRLRYQSAKGVRAHLAGDPDYQSHLVRFLENHDEARAATAFPWPRHKAAAIIAYLAPGMRFFQMGQETGATKRVPIQLCRGPQEETNPLAVEFYDRLVALLFRHPACRNADWRLINPAPAWAGNGTFDNFVAYSWCDKAGSFYVVVVNYSNQQSQCYLKLPHPDLAGDDFTLVDEMGMETYQRPGSSLVDPGLYIDVEPWRYNVFCLIKDIDHGANGKPGAGFATKGTRKQMDKAL